MEVSIPEENLSRPEVQNLLVEEGQAIGERMHEVLPFNFTGFDVVFKRRKNSQKLILPSNTTEGAYSRIWLNRKAAWDPMDSPINLIGDTVDVNTFRRSQSNQTGMHPRTLAVYDPQNSQTGLNLMNHHFYEVDKSLSSNRELATLRTLGTLVTQIEQLEFESELQAANIEGYKEFKDLA